jgi:predicted RNA-binding Zn-ribbon protein involved in translation (DUF1610 family)
MLTTSRGSLCCWVWSASIGDGAGFSWQKVQGYEPWPTIMAIESDKLKGDGKLIDLAVVRVSRQRDIAPDGRCTVVSVGLLPVGLILLPAGWLMVGSAKRARIGRCVSCGRDMRALSVGLRCPGCGGARQGSFVRSGRRRRLVGWAAVSLGAVAAAGFLCSGFWGFSACYSGRSIKIQNGGVSANLLSFSGGLDGWSVYQLKDGSRWWRLRPEATERMYEVSHSFGLYTWVTRQWNGQMAGWSAVIWPVPLVLGGGGVMLLRSGRRAKMRVVSERCAACGYHLAGLPDNSKCPECGKTPGTSEGRPKPAV